jgi:hypothetical protein
MAVRAITHFDFDKGSKGTPSCSFTLGGREWHCRSANEIPWSFTRDLMLSDADDQSPRTAVTRIDKLFRGILIPSEVEDFMTMVDAPDSAMTVEKLNPVVEFITKEVLRRPTPRSSASQPGSPRTRTTSKRGSSSRGRTTPKKRASTG